MLPIPDNIFINALKSLGIIDIKTATIRQINSLASKLENEANEEFIRLELGNPGLKAESSGIEAEKIALDNGVASVYPDVAGIPELKKAGSDFVRAFLDLDIPPKCIVPTVGSMQASYTLMSLLKLRDSRKDSILFLAPGFPAQRHQAKMVGLERVSFDIYDYRGIRLKEKLEEILSTGKITAILYNNPNNPSWTNLTEQELKIIGDAATKYNVIVIEDLAYLGMDYRRDFSEPYIPPFIPSVGKFTDNYILLISASKIFSYAGQRVAIVCMSKKVYESRNKNLEDFFEMSNFGECFIYGVLYTASSGVAHSPQYGFAEMLKKAVNKELPFIKRNKEYAERASKMKDIFFNNGFHLVYNKDGEENISDGFFFTIGYENMSSEELQKELLRYGIATISLPSTGSYRNGVRVCVSKMNEDGLFNALNIRLKQFKNDYKKENVS